MYDISDERTNMKEVSVRSLFLRKRTYCRPVEGEDRLESWDEVCDRVIAHQRHLWEEAQGKKLNAEQEEELAFLRHIQYNRLGSLAGRTLWLGGTDIAKTRASSNFNCFSRDTKFVTYDGVKSFEDFKDGDLVQVLTHNGRYRQAVVRNYGDQEVFELEFHRGRNVQKVKATRNHTWILNSGQRTRLIEVGDKLLGVRSQVNAGELRWETMSFEQKLWWCHGFVFGDGGLSNKGTSAVVRLCGEKSRYLERFTEMGFVHSYPPSASGDPFVYLGSSYLKTVPDYEEDVEKLAAFVRGYLDADGAYCDKRDYHYCIQASGYPAVEFIRNVFPKVGVFINKETDLTGTSTNYGPRKNPTVCFTLFPGVEENARLSYKLHSLTSCGVKSVWCLEVEDDHSFVLPNGMVTGNCSFVEIENVHDVVDAFWLLLQGCGVGFSMRNGNLTGFRKRIKEIVVIRSLNKEKGDLEQNEETYDETTKTWTIKLGDSAKAWAKAIGKLLVGNYPADKLVLDFSEIRKAGQRLKGYGWICSGDEQIATAFEAIAKLLNNRAGSALSKIDMLDVLNWLGSTLSSRRSAQIALMEYGDKEWENFATAKKEFWIHNPQRAQSNNSIVFNSKPSKEELEYIFDLMVKSGGSEPGFINMEAARARAPFAKGVNPCAEILLTNGGFCNLVEHNLDATANDTSLMRKVQYYLARANYRQTCVNLRDGILQEKWHTNNDFYRLCGVGLTGIVQANLEEWQFKELMRIAVHGAYSMADELDSPRPKNITCIKPSGSLSKIMDCTEGLHKPLGRYVFNNVNFSKYDTLVPLLGQSGYRVKDHPLDPSSVLITLPVEYEGVKFEDFNGTPVNMESALDQLERYKMLMLQYVDQNASTTIYYDPSEVDQIINWLLENWSTYVGVSFLFRTDPTKTAADLGYLYLPQEVVDEKTFKDYTKNLKPVQLEGAVIHESDEIPEDAECATGACPIR